MLPVSLDSLVVVPNEFFSEIGEAVVLSEDGGCDTFGDSLIVGCIENVGCSEVVFTRVEEGTSDVLGDTDVSSKELKVCL